MILPHPNLVTHCQGETPDLVLISNCSAFNSQNCKHPPLWRWLSLLVLSFLSYPSSHLPSSVSHRSTYIRSLSNFPEVFSLLTISIPLHTHLPYPPPTSSFCLNSPQTWWNVIICLLQPCAFAAGQNHKARIEDLNRALGAVSSFLLWDSCFHLSPLSLQIPSSSFLSDLVSYYTEKKNERKKESAKNFHRLSTTSSAFYAVLIYSPGDQDKKLINSIPPLGHYLLSLLLQCFSCFSEHQLFPSLLNHFQQHTIYLKK